MTTDNFYFYLQSRLIQTSQTGGDTFPFSIPCLMIQNHLLQLKNSMVGNNHLRASISFKFSSSNPSIILKLKILKKKFCKNILSLAMNCGATTFRQLALLSNLNFERIKLGGRRAITEALMKE